LVKFYAKVKKDRRVGPWLLRAMHRAHRYGSDGTYQFFGLPSATTGAAVKQGWGIDYDDWGRSADFNTTGFVNGDRYAVAILARGPSSTYGRAIGGALTNTARLLLPGGRFPDATPAIQHMSHRSGPVTGAQPIVVRGTDLTHVSAVLFGGAKGTSLRSTSSTSLAVTAPAHAAGQVSVRVVTDHGTSSVRSYYTYVQAPTVTSISPTSGPAAGGTRVTVQGTDFTNVTIVLFGSVRASSFTVASPTTLTVVAPPGTAGPVGVRVHTWYGTSPLVDADVYTYVAPPAAPAQSPSSGGFPSSGTAVSPSGGSAVSPSSKPPVSPSSKPLAPGAPTDTN
jgi:hypothetical protein